MLSKSFFRLTDYEDLFQVCDDWDAESNLEVWKLITLLVHLLAHLIQVLVTMLVDTLANAAALRLCQLQVFVERLVVCDPVEGKVVLAEEHEDTSEANLCFEEVD